MHDLVRDKTGVDFEAFGGDLEVGAASGAVQVDQRQEHECCSRSS